MEKDFEALVVVSPACMSGEVKNQDRARYFKAQRIGCVCDGVSTSPYSAEAAGTGTRLSPALFNGDVAERLRVISEVLIADRLELQLAPLCIATDKPEAVRKLIEAAVRQRQGNAYQTTLAAVQLTFADDYLNLDAVWCGDSAIFAFSAAGELVWSSMVRRTEAGTAGVGEMRIHLAPGEELWVKVLGTLADSPERAERAGIDPVNAGRWLVCLPVELCENNKLFSNGKGVWLRRDEPFFVPHYVVGRCNQENPFRRLRYSQSIRTLTADHEEQGALITRAKGAATTVLPDHVLSGCWSHCRERLPNETHIVLATDGFYTSFDNPMDMWAWLRANDAALQNPEKRQPVLNALHTHLHARSGDDDISFIWIRPTDSTEARDDS